ncbi:hypothetical protein CcaverHIS002_0411700 [Cutaneotrichosporon cavernicola]|uniref:Uncharacterized protein n=1 Tax=Cutaneotrichosporon cavernicola TaxID=279322 RepID=A0AA48L5G6_9TREE|nr:uncharacterized protein CcaverHIS019_0411640 [Cutaneotrichosporon cavernicola]BEI84566.1 hypothetical protein CcaverHIS002_0411700 [Cutaneotrichosporon cavernicola]BEI92344.1 hypothetical protein CcaverHIS019_0411640 [Cutaneotrichosporon cavernicola]BEJ00113.1 hypothetical protein CcaverHIS631_0411550 [Cutaneotrichosporon cavernicola]BEJ07884.1 hypothetical protein CcaverHIS641_0411530 [Cutaneotrichosporon cavernicola]
MSRPKALRKRMRSWISKLSRRSSDPSNPAMPFSNAYPHILDAIADAADYETGIALRAVNRQLKQRIDENLARHLVLHGDHICAITENGIRRYPPGLHDSPMNQALQVVARNSSPGPNGFVLGRPVHPIAYDVWVHNIFEAPGVVQLRRALAHIEVLDYLPTTGSIAFFPAHISVLRLSGLAVDIEEHEHHAPLYTIDSVDTLVLGACSTFALPPPYMKYTYNLPFDINTNPPRRVVIHLTGQVKAIDYLSLISSTAWLPGSELVVVLQDLSNHWVGYSCQAVYLLEGLLLYGEHHPFDKYTLVNPRATISRQITGRSNPGFPDIPFQCHELGEILKLYIDDSRFKSVFRYLTHRQFLAEIGVDRYMLEMGW